MDPLEAVDALLDQYTWSISASPEAHLFRKIKMEGILMIIIALDWPT